MSQRWDEQADAERIVGAHLGGVVERRDPGGGPVQLHDFDVHMAGRQVVAVEVTRHTVQAEIESRAAAARMDWRFESLGYDWVLKMAGRFIVKDVHRQVAPLLAALEAAGIDSFNLKHDEPAGEAEAALVSLRVLGVRRLYRLGEATKGGGEIGLGDASVAGSTAPDVVVEVAERLANLPDNAVKLATLDADERHLFIWVESANHQVVAAMRFDVLPQRSPELPELVDAVWLATAYDIAQVWRYARERGWEDLGVHRLSQD